MIEAVADLGRFMIESSTKKPGQNKITSDDEKDISSFLAKIETNQILFILIDESKGKFEYSGIVEEKCLPGRAELYLFSPGAKGGGTNFTPACYIKKPKVKKNAAIEQVRDDLLESISKTFLQKIENWFTNKAEPLSKRLSNNLMIEPHWSDFISSISDVIKKRKNDIINDIVSKLLHMDTKKSNSVLLSLKVDGKYIGEYEIFKIFLQEHINEKNQRSSSQGKVCSICKSQKDNVYGNITVFKFYTIDKPGFIKGGFDPELAWKNFPVCSSCQRYLNEGRKVLEDKLQFKFYGFKYLLIPKFALNLNSEYSYIIDTFVKSSKNITLSQRTKKSITDDENEILEELSSLNDTVSITMLFLVPQMGAERIALMIEDVLPSYLNNIFKAKSFVEEKYSRFFNQDVTFTFANFRHFFSKSNKLKRRNDLDAYFFEIVESVFKKKYVHFDFLLNHICRTLQEYFVSENFYYFELSVKYAVEIIEFLKFLNILKKEGDDYNMNPKTPFDEVLDQFPTAYKNPAVKGIILLGALCEILMRIQLKRLNPRNYKTPPFAKNLKGLRLKQSDIIELLPKIQNKLMEYSSFGNAKKLIAQSISELLLNAGDEWNLSSDEVSFYFACGMNIGAKIRELASRLTNDTEEMAEEKE